MNKKLFLHSTAIMMAAMLCVSFSSCKNSNNRSENNAEATLSDFSKRSAAAYANYYHAQEREFDQMDEYAPGEERYDSYGQWELKYNQDEFGEPVYSKPFILLVLNNAYWAGYENSSDNMSRGSIAILASKGGCEFRVFDSIGMQATSSPLIFRTNQGDYTPNTTILDDGTAMCGNENDLTILYSLFSQGNFTIKVGPFMYKVTNETKGFQAALSDHVLNN